MREGEEVSDKGLFIFLKKSRSGCPASRCTSAI